MRRRLSRYKFKNQNSKFKTKLSGTDFKSGTVARHMLAPVNFVERINIFEKLTILLILFIPLYPKFPLLNVPGTYVAVRFEDILVAVVVGLWIVSELRQGWPISQEKIAGLFVLYWSIGALSLLSALLITKNIAPHLALLHFIRRIEYMSLFFVAYTAVRNINNLRNLGLVFLLVTLGVISYGFGQKYFGLPVVSTMNSEFSKGLILSLEKWARINSTFAGHYDLAAYLVMMLALSAGLLFCLKRRLERILALIVGLFSVYLLVLTASRISYVAYLFSITLTFLLLKKYRWLLGVLVFSLMLMLFSADIRERYALTFNIDTSLIEDKLAFIGDRKNGEKIVQKRLPAPGPKPTEEITPRQAKFKRQLQPAVVTFTPAPTKEATAAARIEKWEPTTEKAVEYSSGIRFKVEWPRALRAFAKNPFLGTGYSSVTLATDNDYLRALAETGLLGFVSFGLIFLEIARRVILFLTGGKEGIQKMMVIGITGSAIGLFVNATFIDVFEASKVAFVFWILMGSLVATLNLSRKNIKT